MMYADCSATLENADMETNVVTRILPVTQSILLVVKLLLSLALTSSKMDRVNMGNNADSHTQTVMLQKNPLPMVLLTMLDVEAVEGVGEEVVVVVVDEAAVVVAVGLACLLLQLQPLLLALLLLPMLQRKRRMMKSK